MISCPGERTLIELVDGEVPAPLEAEVLEHLAECDDCRALIGRSEAALRYAMGGLTDSGAWPQQSAPRRAWRLTPRRIAAVAAVALVICVVPYAVTSLNSEPSLESVRALPPVAPPPPPPIPPEQRSPLAAMRHLLARADALAAVEPTPATLMGERDLLALGALAGATARADVLGPESARARLQDVVERFPGTPSAREARAMIAALPDVAGSR